MANDGTDVSSLQINDTILYMRLFTLFATIVALLSALTANARTVRLEMKDFGLTPKNSTTERFNKAFDKALAGISESDTAILVLTRGTYDFKPSKKLTRRLFVSNHDQPNPKNIGIILDSRKNIIIDGAGSDLNFHGSVMMPIAMINCTNTRLENVHIDFPEPQIGQIEIISNDTISGTIVFRPSKSLTWEVSDGHFRYKADDKMMIPCSGIAFDPITRHILYRTSDLVFPNENAVVTTDGTIVLPWDNKALIPGTVVALRDYSRPAPAIFVDRSRDINLKNVTVHYANGMGLLAQNTVDITLDGFCVRLRGNNDPRYFTTQADATHFSGCRGHIESIGGIYEAMMDDAINVHGTYLKIKERVDNHTVIGEYMHHQSYGFLWGLPGDSVQFIRSQSMETVLPPMTITEISATDMPTTDGAKLFRITLDGTIPEEIDPQCATFGIENLSASPSVRFAGNTVRNNRARGALFSTPKKVICENNLFDHTSGTAVLLCGDCNGWFETGACHDVTIRGNIFRNALTNMFQFTNGVISIYPEIPSLDLQQQYFHSNITITGNRFETFDTPLLYAKSVNGLIFLDNEVIRNNDFPAFHWNQAPVFLERVNEAKIQ